MTCRVKRKDGETKRRKEMEDVQKNDHLQKQHDLNNSTDHRDELDKLVPLSDKGQHQQIKCTNYMNKINGKLK